MPLPSLNYLLQNAKTSFLRFPLVLLSSLLASSLGIYLIENNKTLGNIFPTLNLMLCAGIGIPLYFCATILSQTKGLKKNQTGLVYLFATAMLVALYFTLPGSDTTHNTSLPYIRYAIYNITCHLLVSFVPFTFSRQLNAFWQYNKTLFLRIIVSGIYSSVLNLGLILALTALRLLFDIKIHDQLYFDIWVVCIGFFNTWIFVGGIPQDIHQLETQQDYPKALRVFAQYLLLPLLALYLVILYAYGAKILLSGDWPRGIVSYLIICISVLGTFSFLLLHPYGQQTEHAWIRKASRGYYVLLLPLLVLLFMALLMRVGDYGITINRYILLLLGAWLTLISLYSALGKTNIKFIPISLAVMMVLFSFGPWGMFAVSEKSQVNRLQAILAQNKVLVNNKVQNEPQWELDSEQKIVTMVENKNESLLTDSLHNEVYSILKYLDEHHGFSSIKQWYQQDLDSLFNKSYIKSKKEYAFTEAEIYMRSLGLQFTQIDPFNNFSNLQYSRSSRKEPVLAISGHDYLINFAKYNAGSENEELTTFDIENSTYSLLYKTNSPGILILQSEGETIEFNLVDLVAKLSKQNKNNLNSDTPASMLRISQTGKKMDATIQLESIEAKPTNGQFKLVNFSGQLLIKIKKEF